MKASLLLPTVLTCAVTVCSQNDAVIPAECADLPGNAMSSMPLRWSHGAMQIRIRSSMLPASFIGKTISGLRLRRPAHLGAPAYGPLQRTITVKGCFDTASGGLGLDRAANQPANLATLFGPAQVSVGATPAQGVTTTVGDDLVTIAFTTPLLVIAGTLFLEIEAGDVPLTVGSEHWVDSVWIPGGVEKGYAVPVGDGSCTTRIEPTEVDWHDTTTGPVVGGTASLRTSGVAPGALVFTWFGIEPQTRASGPTFFGYGGTLSALDPGLASCHQWAPIDGSWSGTSDQAGIYDSSFQLVSGVATIGMRLGVQSLWLDTARQGLPVSVSNGLLLVVKEIGVGSDCSTQYFPGNTTTAPWGTYLGHMPVIVLEHN